MVQTLIEAGADKNSADEAGATALYTAAQYGHAEVVQRPRELRKALTLLAKFNYDVLNYLEFVPGKIGNEYSTSFVWCLMNFYGYLKSLISTIQFCDVISI